MNTGKLKTVRQEQLDGIQKALDIVDQGQRLKFYSKFYMKHVDGHGQVYCESIRGMSFSATESEKLNRMVLYCIELLAEYCESRVEP